ncbi:hypothetical protein BAUCODRAFT_125476 [Baudoinia panamericana UAMH 10762]|uniref:C2H2-type domain-containing protein n=1 Tax=Baudoinia panamericana (strain UAMH 10762) TaxID=717646 RepID=M2LHK4_BAUPA|nr:uncharacterized protein BAUCODRAFT_125476 [Baudoinia panamericana UAMH 10762]EMC93637.1 hypothetical protein BAUCODRAFT_125476 [Baudoinia panamericana UAMH 10762]
MPATRAGEKRRISDRDLSGSEESDFDVDQFSREYLHDGTSVTVSKTLSGYHCLRLLTHPQSWHGGVPGQLGGHPPPMIAAPPTLNPPLGYVAAPAIPHVPTMPALLEEDALTEMGEHRPMGIDPGEPVLAWIEGHNPRPEDDIHGGHNGMPVETAPYPVFILPDPDIHAIFEPLPDGLAQPSQTTNVTLRMADWEAGVLGMRAPITCQAETGQIPAPIVIHGIERIGNGGHGDAHSGPVLPDNPAIPTTVAETQRVAVAQQDAEEVEGAVGESSTLRIQNSDGSWSCAVEGCTNVQHFTRPGDLNKHQRQHQIDKYKRCGWPECHFSTRHLSHLVTHREASHLGVTYQCPVCSDEVTKYENLVGPGRHMAKRHPGAEVVLSKESCRRVPPQATTVAVTPAPEPQHAPGHQSQQHAARQVALQQSVQHAVQNALRQSTCPAGPSSGQGTLQPTAQQIVQRGAQATLQPSLEPPVQLVTRRASGQRVVRPRLETSAALTPPSPAPLAGPSQHPSTSYRQGPELLASAPVSAGPSTPAKAWSYTEYQLLTPYGSFNPDMIDPRLRNPLSNSLSHAREQSPHGSGYFASSPVSRGVSYIAGLPTPPFSRRASSSKSSSRAGHRQPAGLLSPPMTPSAKSCSQALVQGIPKGATLEMPIRGKKSSGAFGGHVA